MKTVFVVGAGPAGLYASNKLAQAGHQVVLFNRDLKPGGLAEYGIYPVKEKMKSGLRKQFGKILSQPNLHYLGNVPVSKDRAVTLDVLREFAPTALVCAVGAQGTKKLGLEGEDSLGVYSAKDFVYHYNLLPPFSSQDFSTGKRVAIVGMGNVMVDIARWLLIDDPDRKTEEVIVVARRGPFEAKFDHKEFDHIEMFLDCKAFQDELERVKGNLDSVGQDISKLGEATFPVLAKPAQETPGPRLRFSFLTSPQAIHAGAENFVQKPWDNARLLASVRTHIELARALRRGAWQVQAGRIEIRQRAGIRLHRHCFRVRLDLHGDRLGQQPVHNL